MKVTRVAYTVRAEFVEENKRNIAAVMRQLRELGSNDVKYTVYLQQDGRTFMHLVHQRTAEAERYPTSLESFKTFQAQLKPNLEVSPKVETFALVESSTPIF
jgi:putative heme iron utilization protein